VIRNTVLSRDSGAVPARTTIGSSERIVHLLGRKPVRALMARRNGPGLLFLFLHATAIATTGTLVWASLDTFWVAPAIFIHGIMIVHLFAPFHECCHRTAFRSRWLNESVYWCCGLILGLMPLAFRFQHADHHTYTQDRERDPQMIAMGERLSGYLFYASALPYFAAILKSLLLHALGRFNPAERRYLPSHMLGTVRLQAWIFWGGYLFLGAASVWLESWFAVIYWLLPRLVGEPVERIIRLSEHTACSHSPDMLENSRTIVTWRPVRWLSWNMPFHTAHHAVPLVPFHALPTLSAMLTGHLCEVRQGYVDAVAFQLSRASGHRTRPTQD